MPVGICGVPTTKRICNVPLTLYQSSASLPLLVCHIEVLKDSAHMRIHLSFFLYNPTSRTTFPAVCPLLNPELLHFCDSPAVSYCQVHCRRSVSCVWAAIIFLTRRWKRYASLHLQCTCSSSWWLVAYSISWFIQAITSLLCRSMGRCWFDSLSHYSIFVTQGKWRWLSQ